MSVTGIVTDIQYLGAESKVRVRLDRDDHRGTSMIASMQSDGPAGFAIGDSVRLAWPRSAALRVADTEPDTVMAQGEDS
jgi:hypothetical protein